jgi:hypothetical protein
MQEVLQMRLKEGSFNRSKLMSMLKRQARARKNGEKPEPAPRWTSMTIMRVAGNMGMLDVKMSRRICGYRWTTPSRYEPGYGAR